MSTIYNCTQKYTELYSMYPQINLNLKDRLTMDTYLCSWQGRKYINLYFK